MLASSESYRRVDLVVLVALTVEYQAALRVDSGAWESSFWEEEIGPNGLPVAFRTFRGKRKQPLRVAVAMAGEMGAVATTNALLPLIDAYRPRCVAACGVCAGRADKTRLGDVIIADRLVVYDTGMQLLERRQRELETYILRDDWKVTLEHFDFAARFQDESWWKKRPVPYEWQQNWVLAKLLEGVQDPSALPECEEFCPQWEGVVESLWKAGYLHDGTLTLTNEGRKHIDKVLIKQRNRFPDIAPSGALYPFNVHVAPMGSGNRVVEDKGTWSFVSEHMRKTLGLEMDAAAFGALVHAHRDLKIDVLVMKGVMDFANHGKDSHFAEFAARASIECLIAFLRECLEVEVFPAVDDLLVAGTSDLPKYPPPSALLNACYEVVPFYEQGRETILGELERWCDEGPSVAVRLLHAEGGAGKTRFAIEWMRRRRAQGWAAGFLPQVIPEDWFERLWMLGQPVLVVIDYAESRPDLFAALLRAHRYFRQQGGRSLRRVRILLLARSAGEWWLALLRYDTALGTWLTAMPPYELPPLAISTKDREAVFQQAAKAFAQMRRKKFVKGTTIDLSDEHFDRVLYLHMAALAAVEGLTFEATTLMDVILDHEERFWEMRARQDDVARTMQRSFARQMVAAATLHGGLADYSATSTIAERLLGRTLSENEEVMLRLLHRIYQRTGNDLASFLPALEPTLLGEGMVLRIASPRHYEDRVSANWIEQVFPPNIETQTMSTGLEVLGRASAKQPDAMRPWIARLLANQLRQRAPLALKAAKSIGLRTAFSVLGDVLADRLEAAGDVDMARELEVIGIPYPTVSLSRVAEWMNRKLLQALPASTTEETLAERARLLSNLGTVWRSLGQREEALGATRQAVEFHRFLAQRNPDAFQPLLAMSLNNLGSRLGELGLREEALEVTREAVELYRILAQKNPDVFRPDLAMGLNNLGSRLSEQGRLREALKSAREAVEHYRALAQHNPDAFQPYLAGSLGSLGSRLSEQGRLQEALECTHNAVELYRGLAQSNPDAFLPDLARHLNSLGSRLSELGLREEALEVTREAVEIYRALVERNFDAFRPDLAMGLHNLGNRLSEQGRLQEALRAVQEAVEHYRALAQRNPGAFQSYLAGSLNSLGSRLSEKGQLQEALEAMRESIGLFHALAQNNPEAFRPSVAMSLVNLGRYLSEMGRPEEAVTSIREAVALYQALAQHNPDAFQPDLARSLNNLSVSLDELGRREEALESVREAVKLYRALVQRNPDSFQPSLARSLNNLGARLSALGWREEALESMREGVELFRALMQRNPDAVLSDLAMSLNNLGVCLAEQGLAEEALKATQEAVDYYRTLSHDNPDAFQFYLAGSLNNLGNHLKEVGRQDEAIKFIRDAIAIYKTLAASHPESFFAYLAGAFENLEAKLRELGLDDEAQIVAQEAFGTLRPIFERLAPTFAETPKALISQQRRGDQFPAEAEVEALLFSAGQLSAEELRMHNKYHAVFALKAYCNRHAEIALRFDESGGVLRLENYRSVEALEVQWDRAVGLLSSSHEEFATPARDVIKAFCAPLWVPLNREQSFVYKRFHGFKIDSSSVFENTNLPVPLPVVVLQALELIESDVDDIRHLLAHVMGMSSRIGLLLLLFHESKQLADARHLLAEKLRRGYAYDIIVLAKRDVQRLMAAKDPHQALRWSILSQVDLRTVSPFVVTGPTPDRMFFGREKELREIAEHAATTSYAIIGGRRIGKTSSLSRLHRERLPLTGFRTLYFDCSATSDYEELVDTPLYDWRPDPPPRNIENFGELFRAPPTDKPLVLLLDEADKLVEPDRAAKWRLFSTLRALASSGRMQVVLGGERTLWTALQDSTSPLFNFTNQVLLGPLDRRSVEELVKRPMRQLAIEIAPEEAFLQRVWAITFGHPNVVQRLCHRLVERLNEQSRRRLTLDDIDAVSRDPGFLRDDFLSTYWEAATPLEKAISLVMASEPQARTLRTIRSAVEKRCNIEPTIREVDAALQRLVDLRSLLVRAENSYEFAVAAFPRVIQDTVTLEDMLEVLAEDYLDAKAHSDTEVRS